MLTDGRRCRRRVQKCCRHQGTAGHQVGWSIATRLLPVHPEKSFLEKPVAAACVCAPPWWPLDRRVMQQWGRCARTRHTVVCTPSCPEESLSTKSVLCRLHAPRVRGKGRNAMSLSSLLAAQPPLGWQSNSQTTPPEGLCAPYQGRSWDSSFIFRVWRSWRWCSPSTCPQLWRCSTLHL